MKILHLSDTTLSGSPIRTVDMINKYTEHEARHMVWHKVFWYRTFKTDLCSQDMPEEEIREWLDWADVLHFHNRWRRQEVFLKLGDPPPDKPSVIQMHSPRLSENFYDEVSSKIPIAIIAQYHVRQWPELTYVVPNCVDIRDPIYKSCKIMENPLPVVSYAPSNVTAKGWDDKGYGVVMPVLKRLKFSNRIRLQTLVSLPHEEVMEKKQVANIGIDEVVTGSYHLSSLEYLGMGVPTFANIDERTEKVVKDLTGCEELPWIQANRVTFRTKIDQVLSQKSWDALGDLSKRWMETYWSPEVLMGHYVKMYEDLT